VPLITAAAGLIAGLAAGLVSTVLTRRWATADRLAAWQREDRLRWQADRLQIYARLVSALEDWDAGMRRIMGTTKDPEPFDNARWERHEEAVSQLELLVVLTAPEKVRDLARQSFTEFGRAGSRLSEASGTAGDSAEWRAAMDAYEETGRAVIRLTEAMRADLALGGDGLPEAGAPPRPAGRPPAAPAG
jgi:hypothetical protein